MHISLQEAVWRTLNLTSPCLASEKKSERAQAKLFAIALCDIMKKEFGEFAAAANNPVNMMEPDLYYTKEPPKDVTALPADAALSFVRKNLARAHKEYMDKFDRASEKLYETNPGMKRLTPEEIKAVEAEPEDDGDDDEDDLSEAGDDEYYTRRN